MQGELWKVRTGRFWTWEKYLAGALGGDTTWCGQPWRLLDVLLEFYPAARLLWDVQVNCMWQILSTNLSLTDSVRLK